MRERKSQRKKLEVERERERLRQERPESEGFMSHRKSLFFLRWEVGNH